MLNTADTVLLEEELAPSSDMIRYTISGEKKDLRFVHFEVLSSLKNTKYEDFLIRYFLGRPLREVSREDIPVDYCQNCENGNDLQNIFDSIIKLKNLIIF